MDMQRWEPWKDFAQLQHQFNKMLDEFFRSFQLRKLPRIPAFSPIIDMYKSEKELVVRVALPGILEEDIDVTFEEGSLVIRGESGPPLDAIENSHIFSEWRYGYFERRILIPEGYSSRKANIEYSDGVLEIRLEKS